MNYNTVAEARKNGFKVRVGHYRLPYESGVMLTLLPKSLRPAMEDCYILDSDGADRDYFPRGGSTSVEIEKDGVSVFGVAHCSLVDNYNKKSGVKIALQRAFEALSDAKHE
jgi:hypothetical protein